jgi:hypothetical protein
LNIIIIIIIGRMELLEGNNNESNVFIDNLINKFVNCFGRACNNSRPYARGGDNNKLSSNSYWL